jgi:hypothetical protein
LSLNTLIWLTILILQYNINSRDRIVFLVYNSKSKKSIKTLVMF